MDKTLRTAATGLTAQQRFVEIISNNLANVNTTGFKKTRPEFQDLLYENIRAAGNTQSTGTEPLNEIQIGAGTELVATTKQFSQGDIQQTNNPLDMAITGDGFFIMRKPDNSFAYTRDGSFKLDKNGQIVNSQGYILDPGITIPDNAVDTKISKNGIISVRTDTTADEQIVGQIELARFVNPAGLRAMGDNLFTETPASGRAIMEQPGINNTGEIVQAHLEASNVDLVQEMVNMIVAQRAYELNSKSVKTADEILSTATNLKR
ncbi:MAG: flagellar basal-body rod protein FlgG [Ignavibacteria bacterium]|jgi:flagellar basal-body rod protein FlgG|nr:flagellar basal-body rod protein FlgG [Ignavibacteria bacterium]